MSWSLSEIEAETRKAARGAGLPWGLAEEAGKAVRWLAMHGIDATAALVDVLDQHADGLLDLGIVEGIAGRWGGSSQQLSPLALGAAICDHARALGDGRRIDTGPVAQPLLIIPFVARAVRLAGRPLNVSWRGFAIVLSDGTPMARELTGLHAPETAAVTCRRAAPATSGNVIKQRNDRLELDPAAWSQILDFAHRTYVPASEISRMRGAGAGTMIDD
jgi:hypothetical protein